MSGKRAKEERKAARQKQQIEGLNQRKRSLYEWAWIPILLLILLAIAVMYFRDGPKEEAGTNYRLPERSNTWVPNRFPISLKIQAGLKLPPLTEERVRKALHFIHQFEIPQQFRTPEDDRISKLVEEYVSKKRKFEFYKMLDTTNDKHKQGYMSFHCELGAFEIVPEVISGIHDNLLAMVLYHELEHAAECIEKMREQGIKEHKNARGLMSQRTVCVHESRGYAAMARFLASLLVKGKFPKVLSMGEGGIFQSLTMAWENLKLGGSDKFCRWYTSPDNKRINDPQGMTMIPIQ